MKLRGRKVPSTFDYFIPLSDVGKFHPSATQIRSRFNIIIKSTEEQKWSVEKKRHYLQRICDIEHSSFSMFLSTGGMAKEASELFL